jgi:hypothetical protein
MSANLDQRFQMQGSADYQADVPGPNVVASMKLGAGSFANPVTGFTYGTTDTVSGDNGLASKMYIAQRTCTAGQTDPMVLGNGSLTTAGVTQPFSKVKSLWIQIVSPDGTKALRVGPQGIVNAFTGPFGGSTGTNSYKEVTDWEMVVNNKWTGYSVVAGTGDILVVKNAGAGDVVYNVMITGR